MVRTEWEGESSSSYAAIIQFCDCYCWCCHDGTYALTRIVSAKCRSNVFGMQGGVLTLLYTDVFSPNSKTWQFEKAVSRIKEDPRCTSLLGNSKEIKAYGEPTGNRWTRNIPIAYVFLPSSYILGLPS